ncbi:hypothetical protein F4808DRAFT_336497 [Astrocystis sublimbata]|nr:hypothetical protein F4808DRAFT_336497 [Astrocystis sublimbata]
MRHTHHLLTPVRALHRGLFLELANTTAAPRSTYSTTRRSHVSPSIANNNTPILAGSRRLPSPPPCYRLRAFSTTSAAAAGPSSRRMVVPKKPQKPRDLQIPHKWVRVADAEGQLGPMQRLETAVAALQDGFSLMMVQAPEEVEGDGGAPLVKLPQPAICRIIDVELEKKKEWEAEKEDKRLAKNTKALELNWAIAQNDLSHRLKRLEEFLLKGYRVEILLARKRGSRKATAQEAQELTTQLQEFAGNVPGAEQYKKMDGDVGKILRLFWEGPAPKKKEKEKGKEKGKKKGKGKGKEEEEEENEEGENDKEGEEGEKHGGA